MKTQIRTKFRWNRADVVAKLDKARLRSLRIAGAEVRKQTTRSMSNRKPRSRPQYWPLTQEVTRSVRRPDGSMFRETGLAVAIVYQVPQPDKVTSWKGGQYPKGYLRQSIEYDYDPGTDTVVVGPATKKRWLNEIHEFGGSQQFHLVPTGRPNGAPKKYQRNTFVTFSDEPIGDSVPLGNRTIKARPFLGPGMRKAMPKIPEMFRNQLRGP